MIRIESINALLTLKSLDSINFGGNQLVDLDCRFVPNGTEIFINTVKDFFILDKLSTLTPDNITIVAAKNISGNWVRRNVASLNWKNITFIIDSVNGNDENTGLDSSHALKTTLEATRRQSGGGGGSSLPTLLGIQFSALIENPIGTVSWSQLTQDMILPAYNITSFNSSSGTIFERGQTVNTPAFTASYVGGPSTSATLKDSVNLVVQNLNSPFTSFASSFNFTETTNNNTVTFTLKSFFNSIQKTATSNLTWTNRVYFGVGTAGFNTSSQIKALGTNILTTNFNRTITVSPINQKVYYSYPVPYGTINNITLNGFPATFNNPITVAVINSFGVSENYYIYESTNFLTGNALAFVVS